MSDKALTTTSSGDLVTFDDDKVSLIKRTVAKGATDDELALFLHQSRRMGLDPLARQIHFQKYRNKRGGYDVSFITTIDGYRLIADRTGCYAGNDEPVYEGSQHVRAFGDTYTVPSKATVTVWKLVAGQRVGFSASAYWDEYYPGDKGGSMWRKMPHVMLGKVAEAAALRKAFPADLSGAYTREEMDQAVIDWQPAASNGHQPPPPAGDEIVIDADELQAMADAHDADPSGPSYADGSPVNTANEAEMATYSAYLDANHGTVPANRQALRAWWKRASVEEEE